MPIPSARDRLTAQMTDAIETAMQNAEDEIRSSLLNARGAVRGAFRQYQRNADINAGMSLEHSPRCTRPDQHPLGIECCWEDCPRRNLVKEILRLGGGDIMRYNQRLGAESR